MGDNPYLSLAPWVPADQMVAYVWIREGCDNLRDVREGYG
jgi:hypothetical protein